MKRRAFNPTAEQRGWVEALSSHGVPEAEICLLIKYPETGAPIGLETLRKHFAEEIATGASKMKLLVGNSIVASILGWDGGLTDEPTQARLAILFAKTRMGWNEVTSGPSMSQIRPMRRRCGGDCWISSTSSGENLDETGGSRQSRLSVVVGVHIDPAGGRAGRPRRSRVCLARLCLRP
jgi:hypothetical protein